MDFLKGIFDTLSPLVPMAVTVAKASVIPLVTGAVVKHGGSALGGILSPVGKALDKIPNWAIPWINLATAGPIGAAGAAISHQMAKTMTRGVVEKLTGSDNGSPTALEKKIGPGRRLSI